ncbi:hypothetical protein KDU73_18455 [Klebsiella michiganensis]|nr:hypothetical protein KDU73_18455 [Klebsiella michiganensis]
MARIRTVKPEFWTDEKVVECSIPARLLFIGLFNFANDMGCLERSPKRLKMQIFPADALDCEPLIQELITHGLLTEYSVNDVCYLQIKGFLKHQKINRPSASKIPLPPEFTESKAGKEEKRAPNQGGLSEDSVNPHGGLTDGKGREGKGKGSNPTLYAHKGNVFQEPQYLPGVDIPIGKFAMHDLWLPSQDWPQLAATWGIALPEPAYLPTELAEFTAYWKSEGKVFTQVQWEQKFARSVINARAKSKSQPATGGNGNAGIQPVNTASRAVQEIQAARERWEQKHGLTGGGYGMEALDGHGGDFFEPLDPEERGGTIGYVDSSDRFDD